MATAFQAGRYNGFDYSYTPTNKGYLLTLNGHRIGYFVEHDARKTIDSLAEPYKLVGDEPQLVQADADEPQADEINAALKLAKQALISQRDSRRHLAKDWWIYGESLAFRRDECRRAAQEHDQINQALKVLERLKK